MTEEEYDDYTSNSNSGGGTDPTPINTPTSPSNTTPVPDPPDNDPPEAPKRTFTELGKTIVKPTQISKTNNKLVQSNSVRSASDLRYGENFGSNQVTGEETTKGELYSHGVTANTQYLFEDEGDMTWDDLVEFADAFKIDANFSDIFATANPNVNDTLK
jgi:hypothetical protein